MALLTNRLGAQPKCKIVHYTTEEGLSHDNLTCIYKDHEGFMWFGTWDGINRYDGHHFISYKSRSGDSSVLGNNRIDQIAEDKNNFLWLRAYDYQVYRFDKKREAFYAIRQSLKASPGKYTFKAIKTAATGEVWLITEKNGVFCTSNPDDATPAFNLYTAGKTNGYGLPSNNISFWHEDSQHHIWIGTDKGLCKLCKARDGKIISHPVTLNAVAHAGFTEVAESESTLYFGTADGYLVSVQKHTGSISAKRLASSAINGLCISKTRDVLYATTGAGQMIALSLSNGSLNVKQVTAGALFLIYEDASGMLWIEPKEQGVIRLNPFTGVSKAYYQINDANYLTARTSFRVFEDNKGNVWINLKGGGFGYYNAKKDVVDYFYNGPDRLTHQFSNVINTLWYDPTGILWLSSDEKGIDKIVFQPNDFNPRLLVEDSYKKSDNEVRGICTDRKGRIWVATKAGKLYVKDAQGNPLPTPFVNFPGSLGQVYVIFQDHTGAFWLGTKSDGLYRAVPLNANEDSYRIEHFKHSDSDPYSISSDEVYTIAEDRQGRIWLGTFDNGFNLVEQQGRDVRFLNPQNYFKQYPVGFKKLRHLGFDNADRLWIGTTNGLIIMDEFDRSRNSYSFLTYTKSPGNARSLANNDIQYIYNDSRGRMWIATSGGGINVTGSNPDVHHLKFRNFSTANGLPNDYIVSCTEDNDHNIWMATQSGLTRYNPVNGKFTSYDSDEGLPKARFAEAACTRAPDGNLVFGTLHGYVNFNPASMVNPLINGTMVLTNLQINNRALAAVGSAGAGITNPNYLNALHLTHDQNIVDIDFTVLDYRSSNKQHYQYRLKNFDKAWRDNKDQRTATYTNLPPGDYEFEVRCINNELYKNVPYRSLAINIAPPFWKTWWAYLIYVIILIALFEFARRTAMTMLRLRHRIAVEQKLAELKMGFFTNVSHELRTPLTLILNPIEEIADKEPLTEQGRQYVSVIHRNASRMVRFINQLLDLRKIQGGKVTLRISNVELVSFINRIMGYFSESAREKNIGLRFEHAEPELYAWIDAEKIDIVIYNLIANAVKFSPVGKNITIRAGSDDNQWLYVEVADEGAGVPEERLNDIFELYFEGNHPDGTLKGTGIGLALSKEFIGLHHGKISARNHPGKGFLVKAELQLGKAHFNHEEAQMIDEPVLEHHENREEVHGLPQVTGVSSHGPALTRLLLVEDNPELRMFLQQQLSALYEVETADNGMDALTKVTAFIPDLIISDVMMPKMDGIQMLDKLKNDPQTSHIPVVLLTARFSVEHQVEGLKYGADLYITKPFQNTFLLAAIDNLLKQRRKLFDGFMDQHKRIKLEPDELVMTSKDEAFLKQIIGIVEKGMEDPEFSIDQVAENVGMGRTTFYTKFKSLTNLAPVEFVRDMRLKRGKQYLDNGETNIATVAYSVGFNNAKYFSTCFKEKYQMTPSEYLKTIKVK